MTTGRIRFLEGDGRWERTEDRTEAGGSNKNHTDEACSPCVDAAHGQWQAPGFIFMEVAASPPYSPLSLPSGQGQFLRNPFCSTTVALAGGESVSDCPTFTKPTEFRPVRPSPVAVPKFPILFEFYNIAHSLSYVSSYLNTSLDGLANTSYLYPTSSSASCRCTR